MQPFEPSECVSSVQARGARVSAEQAELGHAWRQTTRDAPTLDHCLTRSRGQPEQFRRHQSEAGLGRSQSACNHLSPAAHSQRGVRQKACASNEAQECGASRARGAWPRMTLPRSTTRSMMAWAYHASDTVCRRLPHITWERWRGGGGGVSSARWDSEWMDKRQAPHVLIGVARPERWPCPAIRRELPTARQVQSHRHWSHPPASWTGHRTPCDIRSIVSQNRNEFCFDRFDREQWPMRMRMSSPRTCAI
jgi:hypothetical protein